MLAGPIAAAALLVLSACSSGSGSTGGTTADTGAPSSAVEADGGVPTSSGVTVAAPALSSSGQLLDGGREVAPDLGGPSAQVVTLQESPYIGAAVYPRPDYEANPWSQWGQGIALADGRVIVAMGDHLGVDGNSYLLVYDPELGTITRFADVLSALPHNKGGFGYGKIHSQMVDPGDGGVWFTTYYGTRNGLDYDDTYRGDVLFRLDQATLSLRPVSVPVPAHGIASLATDGKGLLFAEPVDPLVDDAEYPVGGSTVIDVRNGDVVSFPDDPARDVFRTVMVDQEGGAWFAGDDGGLFHYEPGADELDYRAGVLPRSLRTATRPAIDGTVYGATVEPYSFFAFAPDGVVRDLGPAREYTASMALLPDDSAFLYVPGAHGDASQFGAPLISVDVGTGEQTTLVELEELVRERFGLVLGGTYSITIDAARNRAHIAFNAGASADEPWGEVVFVVVALP